MEKNKHLPAFPVPITNNNTTGEHYGGLSKREQFAAMAMQGILANHWCQSDYKNSITAVGFGVVARQAVEFADALLTELEK